MISAGAEADRAAIEDLAEDEGWLKAELYVSQRVYLIFFSSEIL